MATASQRSLPVIVLKMTVVMGITWILGFALAFYPTPYLEYAFVIINSCQGKSVHGTISLSLVTHYRTSPLALKVECTCRVYRVLGTFQIPLSVCKFSVAYFVNRGQTDKKVLCTIFKSS